VLTEAGTFFTASPATFSAKARLLWPLAHEQTEEELMNKAAFIHLLCNENLRPGFKPRLSSL
jgi:hypothetical protein